MAGSDTEALERSLDGLLAALRLEPAGEGRFAVRAEPGRFARVFGGQLLAQAVLAAAATVEGKAPQSLHGCFVEAGRPGEDVAVDVRFVRDGRSMATRAVDVHQGDRTLVSALASFHAVAHEPQTAPAPPDVPDPEDMATLQEWAALAPPPLDEGARVWIDRPPPLEVRLPEALTFMGGAVRQGTRSHWMRLPRPVDDPTLDTALLAYASDYFLLDMAFRSRPEPFTPDLMATSLDHAIWFHRPTRFHEWHLHTMETLALSGERGLVQGSIHDREGRLVASVVQEVLVRERRGGPRP